MCKSKSSTSVIQPRNRNRNMNQNRPRPQRSRTTLTSSSSNFPSSTSEVPITESRSYIYRERMVQIFFYLKPRLSFQSQRHSPRKPSYLPLLRDICRAGNFSVPRLSSSSWRCSIRDHDVVVFQRKFRLQMDLPGLRHRLALICRNHHSSLVKLLGASVSGNYIYLVYEFVPGVSLADCLRNRRNPSFTDLSTWTSRMQIASDLAHGLDYIHHFSGSGSGFVHNHIKSSSIVVAEGDFSAKICHFGTSELYGEAVEVAGEPSKSDSGRGLRRSGSRTVRFEGTRGYMAPEFQVTGVATQKTDVYAFGVVVLELLSGNQAVRFEFDDDGGYSRDSVVDTARTAVEEHGGVRKWVDNRLRDSFPVQVVEKMIRVGLECVGEDPNERQDMGRVSIEVSKLYLESKKWTEKMGTNIDFSVSLAPR